MEMVHYLLECKANPGFLDGDSVCALLYARAHGLPIFDTLKSASGKDVIFSMSDLLMALDKNSRKSFELVLNVVLASGVNIDEINEDHGCTILSRAVSDGRLLWAVNMLVQSWCVSNKSGCQWCHPSEEGRIFVV